MNWPTFSPLARTDLVEIEDYISRDNHDAALNFISQIEDVCIRLAQSPGIGRARPEYGDAIRSFSMKSYVIFCRPTTGGAHIVRIVRGDRDAANLFDK